MTLDFAIDLPHPPYDNMILLTFRSQYKIVARSQSKEQYTFETFYYFYLVYNSYCYNHTCNFFSDRKVKYV